MDESEYNALVKRLEIANGEIRRLEKEKDDLIRMNNILAAEKKQWMKQKQVQDMVIKMQLENSDNVVRKLQDEIRDIKKKYNIKD